jgi:voltage-gated potassium channel
VWAFERDLPAGQGFASFGDALWWTAMILTTMGSGYWPVTAEGRILCLILSAYGMAILGYLTASLETFFLGREAHEPAGDLPSPRALEALRRKSRPCGPICPGQGDVHSMSRELESYL